jgi:hypothetical protein
MDALLNTLLAQNILHGLNLLTIFGFVAMGVGLNQSRQGRSRAPVAFALMGLGTGLVILGMYFAIPAG